MGVCCVVFDIDGMLFEFVMNFLNIEFFFSIFHVFFAFRAISKLKKKIGVKKKKIRGWGEFFFFRKTILSHFTFYAIFNIKKKIYIYIEKCPFTYWLNGTGYSK